MEIRGSCWPSSVALWTLGAASLYRSIVFGFQSLWQFCLTAYMLCYGRAHIRRATDNAK
jgi:hypothetical protein